MPRKKKKIANQKIHFNQRNGSILTKNGEEAFLEYRLKGFFTLLFNNKNDVVTREELMNFVWRDVVVNEESITKAASDLRKFFRSNNITEFELITVPKIGYKLKVQENDSKHATKKSSLARFLRVGAYMILVFFLIIMFIRAINY